MLNTQTSHQSVIRNFELRFPWRMIVFVALIILAFLPGEWGTTTRGAMADAYGAVAVFVYATLLFFFTMEKGLKVDLLSLIGARPKFQVVAAAMLGMLPGCGGAIMVVTGYATGRLSFGALVATLTATMGDAAFLLIAEDPLAAAIVLPISTITGIITGLIVDQFYHPTPPRSHAHREAPHFFGKIRAIDWLILAMFIPGIMIGIAGLMAIELPEATAQFSVIGMLVTLGVWAFSPINGTSNTNDSPLTRANEETAFVMIWVLAAFLAFELSALAFGFDLGAAFKTVAIWTPLIAVLVGFIPGCGPQILTTALYLAGAIPFGALMANAISNDGDALFPALAIAPRDSIIATLITAIPALILGYGFYFYLPL